MAETKFLTYKGKPLVRNGNEIYYGNMSDKFVVLLQIVSTKTVGDLQVADKVLIQLMNTDPDMSTRERVVKKGEKNGLYNAMDFSAVWLERALKEAK